MILVFGATGQVARELQRQADVIALNREQADLMDPTACAEAIARYSPNLVINAAAYTDSAAAETNEHVANIINGESPTMMAEACARQDVPLVHLSSDYVFDGAGEEPWQTGDQTGPLNAYGRSKVIGEEGISAIGGRYIILRVSWVFSSHGKNFVKTMLSLGQSRTEISVVSDQIGGPTSASDIAAACLAMGAQVAKDPDLSGIEHYSGGPDVSWADFAREIFGQAKMDCKVVDIPTSAYPSPLTRPLNSRFDCSGLDKFGIERPSWRESLKSVMRELGAIR